MFYGNDQQKIQWFRRGLNSKKPKLVQKENGSLIMVSDFCCADFG